MPYPLALAVTLTVELPIYAGGLRAARLARAWAALAVALVVNLATHPLVWLALRGAGSAYWPRFAAVEVAVWLAESLLILAWLGRVRVQGAPVFVALLALTANGASCLAGLALAVAAAP
ncbi:MAG: hypothetical protein ACM30G_13435 [Micromonosporaceae bacterium]